MRTTSPPTPALPRHDAIVLAGGRASRLGGLDKTSLRTAGGASLLDEALAAGAGARRVVVVGRGHEVVEEPPLGGPVAALAAGLEHLRAERPDAAPWTLVLAADQPCVVAAVAALGALVPAEVPGDAPSVLTEVPRTAPSVVLPRDPGGDLQPLLAFWRTSVLTEVLRALPGGPVGASLRRVLDRVAERGPVLPVDLPARLCADVDTAEDAERLGVALPPSAAAPAPSTAASPTAVGLTTWLHEACSALDLDPSVVDVDAVLDLARDVAHGVARPAAPLTTFLLGVAVGRSVHEGPPSTATAATGLETLRRLARELSRAAGAGAA